MNIFEVNNSESSRDTSFSHFKSRPSYKNRHQIIINNYQDRKTSKGNRNRSASDKWVSGNESRLNINATSGSKDYTFDLNQLGDIHKLDASSKMKLVKKSFDLLYHNHNKSLDEKNYGLVIEQQKTRKNASKPKFTFLTFL